MRISDVFPPETFFIDQMFPRSERANVAGVVTFAAAPWTFVWGSSWIDVLDIIQTFGSRVVPKRFSCSCHHRSVPNPERLDHQAPEEQTIFKCSDVFLAGWHRRQLQRFCRMTRLSVYSSFVFVLGAVSAASTGCLPAKWLCPFWCTCIFWAFWPLFVCSACQCCTGLVCTPHTGGLFAVSCLSSCSPSNLHFLSLPAAFLCLARCCRLATLRSDEVWWRCGRRAGEQRSFTWAAVNQTYILFVFISLIFHMWGDHCFEKPVALRSTHF